MQPVIIDGKTTSKKIRKNLKERVQKLIGQGAPIPVLATILVGDDPASATYVRMKARACEEIGMQSKRLDMPANTSTEDLLAAIDECNASRNISGILLQHPVPSQINERSAFDRIAANKDVDGVTTLGFGQISFGMQDAFPSCTPAGIVRLLDEYNIKLEGKHAVIVGRSPILGRPMGELLLNRNCTVTTCHSKTQNIQTHLGMADIVVAACGKPEFIKGEWLKENVVVIDAGYNAGNVGDVHFESCAGKASFITPVPGGVGPMTITMLLEHTVRSAETSMG